MTTFLPHPWWAYNATLHRIPFPLRRVVVLECLALMFGLRGVLA
jgi:hypothetical protein